MAMAKPPWPAPCPPAPADSARRRLRPRGAGRPGDTVVPGIFVAEKYGGFQSVPKNGWFFWGKIVWTITKMWSLRDSETMKSRFGNYYDVENMRSDSEIMKSGFENYDLETMRSDSETENSGFGNYDSKTIVTWFSNQTPLIRGNYDWKLYVGNHELESMNGKLLQVCRELKRAKRMSSPEWWTRFNPETSQMCTMVMRFPEHCRKPFPHLRCLPEMSSRWFCYTVSQQLLYIRICSMGLYLQSRRWLHMAWFQKTHLVDARAHLHRQCRTWQNQAYTQLEVSSHRSNSFTT